MKADPGAGSVSRAPEGRSRPSWASRNGPAVALALVMLVSFVVIMYAGRGTLPFFDEWDFITGRRGHSLDTLLRPHNGHLVVAPLIVYKALLQIGGLDNYWLFRVVLAALHLVVGLGVFQIARKRIGGWGAVVAAGLVLFCFSAADDMIWAFQISFLMAVASGVWMLWALEKQETRWDLAACLLLLTSVASAAIGIPFALAALILVVLGAKPLSRLWVPLVPVALLLVWRIAYPGGSDIKVSNLPDAPRYASDLAANAAGGLVGLGIDFGRPLILGLAVLTIAVAAGLWRRPGAPFFWAVLTAALALWGLTALARADLGEPLAPRYIYPGAVLIVLICVELFRGRSPSCRALIVSAALLALVGLSNYGTLDSFAGGLRANAEVLKARLGALELVKERVGPDFQPIPVEGPQIRAGSVELAQRDFGRIALSKQQLLSGNARERAAADEVLAQAAPVAALAARAEPSRCRTVRPGPDGTVKLKLDPGRDVFVGVGQPVSTKVTRIGSKPLAGPSIVAGPGEDAVLSAPADSLAAPWSVAIETPRAIKVCRP